MDLITPNSSDTGNDEFLEYEARLIQRWTDNCFDKHRRCGHGSGFTPTRLIDVGVKGSETLRLIITEDSKFQDSRYLALSHCWGLSMPSSARTVTATLEKHKNSIVEDELSRTFRDFIAIARRLHIQYIWIDSLCIIQDDGDDWEKEAAQMASVYSNAYLTIAASASSDGNGGCTISDPDRSYGPIDIDCVPSDDNIIASGNYKFRVWTRTPKSSFLKDPLQTRGWCLQERELSPRVVNYSQNTIRWECRELQATLEFPWGDSLSFNGDHRHFDDEQSVFLPMPAVALSTSSSIVSKIRVQVVNFATNHVPFKTYFAQSKILT